MIAGSKRNRRLAWQALVIVFAVSPCLASNAVPQEPKTSAASRAARVLHFPKDRAIGRVWLYDADAGLLDGMGLKAKDAREAKGDVKVPAGKLVGLQYVDPKFKNLAADQPWDLSPLDELRPSDLDMLTFAFARLPTDEIKRLARHTSLRTLAIGQSEMHEDALKWIGKISSLQVLRFGEIKLSDKGLKHLKDLEDLRVLQLASGGITDDGLPHLAKLIKLVELDLSWSAIADEGLAHLAHLKNLRELRLQRTKVTQGGIAALQKQIPNTKIVSDVAVRDDASCRLVKQFLIAAGMLDEDNEWAFIQSFGFFHRVYVHERGFLVTPDSDIIPAPGEGTRAYYVEWNTEPRELLIAPIPIRQAGAGYGKQPIPDGWPPVFNSTTATKFHWQQDAQTGKVTVEPAADNRESQSDFVVDKHVDARERNQADNTIAK